MSCTTHVLLTLATMLAGIPSAQAAKPKGTYSWWSLPDNPTGYFNIDETIFPSNDPQPHAGQATQAYFYSHQFGTIHGDGGYIGIQTDGGVDGFPKKAIFSWWGAKGATCSPTPGAICRPFGGEGTGYQTIIPYRWQAGHYYRTRVWVVGDNPDGTTTWVGAIADNGVETVIGYINVPTSYGWLSASSVNWVEWYAGDVDHCSEIPASTVYFDPPKGNAGASSAGPPSNVYGSGSCPSSLSMYSTWADHGNGSP